MTDPYAVLGVSRSANADEIKKAYRKLSRIYHPDANVNNPNKKQAEEKFKEVQEAYDTIMYEREHGEGTYGGRGRAGSSSSNYGQGSGSYNSGYDYGFGGFGPFGSGYRERYSGNSTNYGRTSGASGDSVQMAQAIRYINAGQFAQAMTILNSMSQSERNARWYFVHAHANYGIGNVIDATEDARMAVNLEPGNMEYVNLLNQLERGGDWYSSQGESYGRSNTNFTRSCITCIALNVLLNCCCAGGGLGYCNNCGSYGRM